MSVGEVHRVAGRAPAEAVRQRHARHHLFQRAAAPAVERAGRLAVAVGFDVHRAGPQPPERIALAVVEAVLAVHRGAGEERGADRSEGEVVDAVANPRDEPTLDGDGAEAHRRDKRVRGAGVCRRLVAVDGVAGDVDPVEVAALPVPQGTFGELRAGQMVEQTH